MSSELEAQGYRRLGSASEVAVGQLKTFESEGENILVANVDGQLFAIGAICKHEEWDLSEGTLEGRRVICAGHGAKWDLERGRAEFHEPLDPEPVYDVRIANGSIYVRQRS